MQKPHSPCSKRKIARQSGFTLLEILIAVAIVGIMSTIAIGALGNIFGRQSENIAELFVKDAIKLPLTTYRLDVGSYPSTEEGLNALIKAPAGKEARWKTAYVDEVPLDPWGNPYQYKFPGSKNISGARGYDIWSFGPDGTESADDIGNWK